MEAITKAPVSFTPTAVTELKRLMASEDIAKDQVLRIGVKGGGCSGMTYILVFDSPKENDRHFTQNEIPYIMDKAHEIYLSGIELDWEPGLNSRGFVFKNPNASSTCGCGSSFAV